MDVHIIGDYSKLLLCRPRIVCKGERLDLIGRYLTDEDYQSNREILDLLAGLVTGYHLWALYVE